MKRLSLLAGWWIVLGFAFAAEAQVGPIPAIAISPTNLDFGQIAVGQTATLQMTVKNVGGGTLAGVASTDNGSFRIVSGSPFSLGSQQPQVIKVSYQPSGAAMDNAVITFTGGGGAVASAQGSLLVQAATNALIQVSPFSLDFGPVRKGETRTNFFTVQNIGGGVLTGAVIVRPPFKVASGLNYALGPDKAQIISVVYGPTDALIDNGMATFTGGGGFRAPISGSLLSPEEAPTTSAK